MKFTPCEILICIPKYSLPSDDSWCHVSMSFYLQMKRVLENPDEDDTEKCTICLSDFEESEDVRSGSCQGHVKVISGLCRGSCQGHIRVMLRLSQGYVRVMLQSC